MTVGPIPATTFKNFRHRYGPCLLVSLNIFFVLVGQTSGTLLSSFYFDKRGNSKWLAAFIQTAGFSLLLPILLLLSANTFSSTTSTTRSTSTTMMEEGLSEEVGALARSKYRGHGAEKELDRASGEEMQDFSTPCGDGGDGPPFAKEVEEEGWLERYPFHGCWPCLLYSRRGGGVRVEAEGEEDLQAGMVRRLREAVDFDTEAATIIVEVLWGASP